MLARWQGRAEVVRFLEGAIRDRSLLARSPEVAVPPELLDAVEQVLERDVLLGGAGSEFSTGIEHGTLVSARPPSLRIDGTQGRARFLRYASVAAMLVVAVGGTVLTMQALQRQGAPLSTLARSEESPAAPTRPAEFVSSASERETLKLAAVPASKESVESAKPSTLDSARDTEGLQHEKTVIAANTAEISQERALELAREGRLLIRVRTSSVDQAVARMHDGSDRKLAEVVTNVELAPEDSSKLASVVESMRSEARSPLDEDRVDAPVVASDRSGDAHVQPLSGGPAGRAEHRGPRIAVTRLDVRVTGQAFQALRDSLGGKGGKVELVELPEAVSAKPAFDPDDALWWMQAPSTWTPRVAVPVVFEQP